jgi:hypothetical protein
MFVMYEIFTSGNVITFEVAFPKVRPDMLRLYADRFTKIQTDAATSRAELEPEPLCHREYDGDTSRECCLDLFE